MRLVCRRHKINASLSELLGYIIVAQGTGVCNTKINASLAELLGYIIVAQGTGVCNTIQYNTIQSKRKRAEGINFREISQLNDKVCN